MNIYIPISFDCAVSAKLRNNNMRNIAYPFDWNVKTLESIYLCLLDNFNNFFNNDYLVFGNKTFKHKYDNNPKDIKTLIPVYNKRYKILFIHDFNIDLKNQVIIDKYNKRINRFNNDIDINKNNNIFFLFQKKDNDKYKLSIYKKWIDYFDDKNIFNDIMINDNDYIAKINELYPYIKIIDIDDLFKNYIK